MKALLLGALSLVVLGASTPAGTVVAPVGAPPAAPVKPVTDDYFGTKIVDPYRWMEDAPNPALARWMKAQNDYTRGILASIPGRALLLARLKAVSQGTDVEGMQLGGTRMFFTLSTNGDTPKLYYRSGAVSHVVFDPQLGLPAASHGAIEYFAPSPDGRFVAIGVAINGAERQTAIRIVETSTGRDLSDRISRAWGTTPIWVGNEGFFYSRLPKQRRGASSGEAEERQQVFFHRLGRDPDSEKPVFGFGTMPGILAADQSSVYGAPGSPFAIGVVQNGVDNSAELYAAPLSAAVRGNASWRHLGNGFLDSGAGTLDEPGFVDVALHRDALYAVRFDSQHRTQIVRLDLRTPATLREANIVVAASERVHRSLSAAADGLYVWSSSGGLSHLDRVDYRSGTSRAIALRVSGTLSEPATDVTQPGAVFGITTWTQPLQYFTYEPSSNVVVAAGVRSTTVADMRAYATDEVTVVSKDGTRVPLTIIRKRDIALDGTHPTEVIGYGAYGESIEAGFIAALVPWLEQGGIFAFTHVRGGGEFGEPWHLAGKGPQKQHTIDDFIASADYLIANGYTSRSKLAGVGASAGGITIGNAIVQQPELFAVAIDEVGMTDMLRFERTANGPGNIPEFGSVKTPEGFKQLYAMSAYNHVADGTAYPAVLLTTGANDPRVAPWIVAKMAARLQAATSSGKPVLLRVDYGSGHGVDSSIAQFNQEVADEETFELWQMGDPRFQPQQRGKTARFEETSLRARFSPVRSAGQ